MNTPLISLKDVNVTLDSQAGPVNILQNINLEVNSGKTVSIVGPSGSGKTTLLMIMAGLEKITSGKIDVCGKTLNSLNEDQLAKLRGDQIGIVFQSFHLVPTMTALENVALPLEFQKVDNPYTPAKEVLTEVGLSHRLNHFPSQLSGGEQQRVALARALVPKPKLLLADEPTGNLDGNNGEHIMDLIFASQKKYGSTLILITHDQNLAARCETQISINNGQIAIKEPEVI